MSSVPPESPPPASLAELLLEYVTTPFCRDCLRFETLLREVRTDFPALAVRAVAADSARGRELSLERGIMRFPVIVLDGDVIAVESISEEDLRRHLGRTGSG